MNDNQSEGFVHNNVAAVNGIVSIINERLIGFASATAWASGHLTEPFKFPSRENGLWREGDFCYGISQVFKNFVKKKKNGLIFTSLFYLSSKGYFST